MNQNKLETEQRQRITLERLYSEVVDQARRAWTSGVDFIPGVAKYDSHSAVDMQRSTTGGRSS